MLWYQFNFVRTLRKFQHEVQPQKISYSNMWYQNTNYAWFKNDKPKIFCNTTYICVEKAKYKYLSPNIKEVFFFLFFNDRQYMEHARDYFGSSMSGPYIWFPNKIAGHRLSLKKKKNLHQQRISWILYFADRSVNIMRLIS